MGEFSNTSYRDTVNSLTQGYQNRISTANPYYKFTDKKPTPVTYWNINSTMSTLDQGTLQTYNQLGSEAPLRYNKVKNFQLYGIARMMIDIQIGEWGPESSPIEGDAYILPNTIVPMADDYFTIDYLKGDDKHLLFRITKADRDTLETGANFYKVHYILDRTENESYKELQRQTVKTYEYIPSNVGTNFVALLEEDTKNLIVRLESSIDMLKDYFVSIFYRKNVQTFIYSYTKDCDLLIYDPYMVEFLIRNSILGSNDRYIYVSQATFRSNTFSIEYAKTIFKNVEDRNQELSLNTAYPISICDPNSLLVERLEEYFELSVLKQNYTFSTPINILDMDLFDRIVNSDLYDEEDIQQPIYRNIIIGYMGDGFNHTITDSEIKSIADIDYKPSQQLYYEIPLLLYIMEAYINHLMSKTETDDDNTTCCDQCYITRK